VRRSCAWRTRPTRLRCPAHCCPCLFVQTRIIKVLPGTLETIYWYFLCLAEPQAFNTTQTPAAALVSLNGRSKLSPIPETSPEEVKHVAPAPSGLLESLLVMIKRVSTNICFLDIEGLCPALKVLFFFFFLANATQSLRLYIVRRPSQRPSLTQTTILATLGCLLYALALNSNLVPLINSCRAFVALYCIGQGRVCMTSKKSLEMERGYTWWSTWPFTTLY
jgi:hypothetical protein